MNRRTFMSLTATALSGTGCAKSLEDLWPTREALNALFRKNTEFFRSYLPEKFNGLPLEIESDDWIGDRNAEDEVGEPYLWINTPLRDGQIYGIIQVSQKGYIIAAGAHVHRRSSKQDRTEPKWEMAAAIERAGEGLKRLGWEIPPDMQLGKARYSLSGAWEITWSRVFDGVAEVKMMRNPINWR